MDICTVIHKFSVSLDWIFIFLWHYHTKHFVTILVVVHNYHCLQFELILILNLNECRRFKFILQVITFYFVVLNTTVIKQHLYSCLFHSIAPIVSDILIILNIVYVAQQFWYLMLSYLVISFILQQHRDLLLSCFLVHTRVDY